MEVLLPIGSIVNLNIMKESARSIKFIVMRRYIVDPNNSQQYYEYEVMNYPGGSQDGTSLLVNNEQISNIIFRGYADEEDNSYQNYANELIISNNLNKAFVK